jgi:hypothetical protein
VVCGRPAEGHADAREADGLWFCSPSHLLDWEPRRRRRPPGRSAGIAVLASLLGGGFLWMTIQGHGASGPRDPLQQAVAAFKKSGLAAQPEFHFSTTLTPAAMRVGDDFVQARYVRHDCAALGRLGSRRPGISRVLQVLFFRQSCAVTMTFERHMQVHLVRGSRRLIHGCRGAWLYQLVITANECLEYVAVTRQSTVGSGNAAATCGGTKVDVYLDRLGGRWRVIGARDTLERHPGCDSEDLRKWAARVPWRA